jgi:hypothetical protein
MLGREVATVTETEWLACDNPVPMLEILRDWTIDRKLRLYAVACCRRVECHFTDPCLATAVGQVEQFAEGLISREALAAAHDDAFGVEFALSGYDESVTDLGLICAQKVGQSAAAAAATAAETEYDGYGEDGSYADSACSVADAAASVAGDLAIQSAVPSGVIKSLAEGFSSIRVPAEDAERRVLARLLRDILGNPFRPVAANPSWLTSTVLALAEGICADRAFDRLPILADALQDAGCENADILNHCRGGGVHVRGCWVVDLVLGKE